MKDETATQKIRLGGRCPIFQADTTRVVSSYDAPQLETRSISLEVWQVGQAERETHST